MPHPSLGVSGVRIVRNGDGVSTSRAGRGQVSEFHGYRGRYLWKSDPHGPMNQLSRIIVNGSAGTEDEQAAAPDERGSYGDLMDEIDRVLAQLSGREPERPPS